MSFFETPATSVLHPTDFSGASEIAFAHALAIAMNNRAKLTILHVVKDRDKGVPWHEYPAVRKTLQRWNYLEPGASQHDVVTKLGIEVEKAVIFADDVVNSIVGFTENNYFDLIVMATDENREQPFWKRANIAIPVSEKSHLPVLYVPQDVPGFVSLANGTIGVRQILVPVAHDPSADPALMRIAWAVDKLGGQSAHVTLLHVGDEGDFPELYPPVDAHVTWSRETRHGNVATQIEHAATEKAADLIAMVTEGKKGFWDAVWGSTVQQVLRKAPCPIFTMPAE